MGNWDARIGGGSSSKLERTYGVAILDYVDAQSLRVFNVMAPPYNAEGDGVADDTTPVTNAMTAAAAVGGVVLFPPGTYLADVDIPDGVTVRGSGLTSWLKGVISIGANVNISNLTMGIDGSPIVFDNNADSVLVRECALTGGDGAAILYLNDRAVTNVAFVDCTISGNTNAGNGVQIVDKGTVLKHMENITFTRCRFHGNDRMNFECIQRNDVGFPVVQGYRNISLYDCILDIAAGATGNQINISYDGGPIADVSVRSSGYSTVRGCRITGGVYGIELAGPTDVLIDGNDISDTTSDLLSMSQYGTATTEKHIARIIANKFRGATGNVVLQGQGITFADNDLQLAGALRLDACSFSTITGNMIETSGTTPLSLEHSGNNTITANQIRGGSNQTFLFIYTETIHNLVDSNYIDALSAVFDVRDGTTQHYGKNLIISGGTTYDIERAQNVNNVTYSASMTPDSAVVGQRIVVTNGTAMTINAAPAANPGQILFFDILNSSGGALGAITWNAVYKLAGAFTNPASTKHRTISFYYDGSNWIETNRAAADI